MSNKNLRLWDQVCETPSAHLKFNQSTRRHSIGAMHQKEKATEMFGIYGQDWGVVNGSEVYERTQLESTHLLHYVATMYYMFDGRQGQMPIAASVKEAYVTSKGKFFVDDEAIKKVRTDALTKGLSDLGFNADVYKGYHEFEEYTQYADNNAAIKKAEKDEEKQITEAEAYAEWKLTAPDEFALVKTLKAVDTLKTQFTRKALAMGDKGGEKEFALLAETRMKEIREEAKAKKAAKEVKEENQTDIEDVK